MPLASGSDNSTISNIDCSLAYCPRSPNSSHSNQVSIASLIARKASQRRLSGRCSSSQGDHDLLTSGSSILNPHIPFSWALFFIAILHFSVWSVGVCETPAKAFLLKESNNFKGFACIKQIEKAQSLALRQLDTCGGNNFQSYLHLIHFIQKSIVKETQRLAHNLQFLIGNSLLFNCNHTVNLAARELFHSTGNLHQAEESAEANSKANLSY
jgi:hypothetical protein